MSCVQHIYFLLSRFARHQEFVAPRIVYGIQERERERRDLHLHGSSLHYLQIIITPERFDLDRRSGDRNFLETIVTLFEIELIRFLVEHGREITHRLTLGGVDILQGINFEFHGLFKDVFFFVRVGILDVFAEFGNIVHDLFTLIRKRFLDQVHVFPGNGMTSDSMLDNIGTQIQMIINVFIIGMSFGGTFFGSADKDFVETETHGFALEDGKEPGGGTNPSRFQKECRL
mmetsp:Transcript_27230/g.31235  ORF Transcript_27230/g.31235 Transcript_27230/m.31235 type:complete len:230 (-) Transcript_27230:1428-2117(-)